MKLTLRLATLATLTGDSQSGQSRVLTEGRLSIGRGADNDWVLADPDRTLSKNHCRIDASESGFMLTDLSTNGVFLAGQGQAIGRGHSCALEDGDSFSLGPYTLSAAIEDGEAGALRLEQGLGLPQEDEDAIFPSSARARPDQASPIAPAIAEPWLTDIPGGDFGPGRRAAPHGWDAPPDPATYAASGVFESRDPQGVFEARDARGAFNPLDPRSPPVGATEAAFSQASEHLAAPSTVMRLPQAQVVLPVDWNEAPAEAPAAQHIAPETPPAAAAWPPALPTEPEPPPAATLPPAWLAEAPEHDWAQAGPVAALPASWAEPEPELEPEPEPIFAKVERPRPAPEPDARPAPLPAAAVVPPAAFVAPPPAAPVATPPVPVVQPSVASAPVVSAPLSDVPLAAPASPAPSSGDVDPSHKPISAGEAAGLVAAFLEGAGLPSDTLRGADAATAFREIGQMVRAAVDGVRDILATRALVKSEFRVDQTVLRRGDNNAMKFAPDAERCLAAMVGTPPSGFLPGSQAMTQSMDDIKRHELALVAAINTVFADLGRQLDPELIMAKARQETGLGTMLPYAKEVRCWTIYTETHALLQDSGAANTGGSLLAPVAQAYDRQLRRH